MSIAADQQAGNWSKAFRIKNQQLSDFIRPAYPDQNIAEQIKTISKNWTNQVLDALHSHYTQRITQLTNELKHINDSVAIDIALARAKRNFGKKLKLETIKSFLEICKQNSDLAPTNDTNNTNNPDNDIQIQPDKNRIKQNARVYAYQTRSSTKYIHPQDTDTPKKGVHKVHRGTKESWKMENISHKTLIVGDSNLKNVKQKIDDVKVESFPGARIEHITDLAKSYPHAAYKPDNVVVNVGLNNNLCDINTTKKFIDRMCTALKKKFPSSRVFIPQINFSEEQLPRTGIQNLNAINEYLKTKTDYITVIPKLSKHDFVLAGDGYHWTPSTGNKFLKHWLAYLNE